MVICLQVDTELCARVADDSRIDLVSCDSLLSNHRPGGRGHAFELTDDGRLVTSGNCLIVTSSYYVISAACNSTRGEYLVNIFHRRKFYLPPTFFIDLFYFSADPYARSMIGYWHDNVVCLSVCLSVCMVLVSDGQIQIMI